MANGFTGLSIALSGLFANQRAMHVTSHNVSNVNTPGYSRQRMDMQAFRPDQLPGDMGTLGLGTDVTAVKQIRDQYLDYKYRTEYAKLSEWDAKYEILQNIESILNEPSDSGVGKLMDDFFSSLQEVSKNAESISVRTLLRERAIALVKGIGGMASSFKKLQYDVNTEFKVAVEDINGYARQIADLNKVIFESELSGGHANDARDQRNLVLDKLSEYMTVNSYEDKEGRFHVTVGGHILASHYRADSFVCTVRNKRKNPDDVDGLEDVRWADGSPLKSGSGNLKGLIDIRDNIDGEDKGIPYYLNKLNIFMDKLVSEMNRIHKQGYDLNGNKGGNFFTIDNMSSDEFDDYILNRGLDGKPAVDITHIVDEKVQEVMDQYETLQSDEKIRLKNQTIAEVIGDYLDQNPQYKSKSVHYADGRYLVVDRLSAQDINVATDLIEVDKIATSDSQLEIPRNGDNMLAMADIRHNVKLYDWGSPDDYVKSLISNLGVYGNAAKNLKTNQTLLVDNIKVEREAIMGVSLDEEMSNVIRFQHAYSANARMVNTIDEMIDLIVNRLGTVGR